MDEIDLQDIEEALRTEDSPIQLASFLTRLAAIHSYRIEQLKKIQLVKPQKWLEIQKYERIKNEGEEAVFEFILKPYSKPLSDKKTDMTWATTEDGQKEIALTMEIKRIDLLYRSISKRLTAIEQDYRMTKSL